MTAWRTFPAPALPEPPSGYISPRDLPTGQKMVLMLLRRGEVASEIVKRLSAMGCQPAKSDWVAMIEGGRIVRRQHGMTSRLELTPAGLSCCTEIMRDLAQRLGMHVITESGSSGNGRRARGTCGWSIGGSFTFNGARNMQRHILQHLQETKSCGGASLAPNPPLLASEEGVAAPQEGRP